MILYYLGSAFHAISIMATILKLFPFLNAEIVLRVSVVSKLIKSPRAYAMKGNIKYEEICRGN